MSGAQRQRAWRARQRAGKICLLVEVDQHELAEALVDAGLLAWEVCEDHEAIARATGEVLEIFYKEK
jgi:hypothetical protein